MSTDLAIFPTASEWHMIKEQALMLINSGFLPSDIKKPEQAVAIMLKGRELGMPPMLSFAHIHIIKGKPTMSAECMLAQIFKVYPHTKLTYIQNDDVACVIEVIKLDNKPSRFAFSYADAQKAKLTGKDNWNTYRRAMLRSRCISEMSRSLFPEALMGVSYTPEELEDVTHAPIPPDVIVSPVIQIETTKAEVEEVKPEPAKVELFDKECKAHLSKVTELTIEGKIPDGIHEKLLNELHGKPWTTGTLAKAIASVSVGGEEKI